MAYGMGMGGGPDSAGADGGPGADIDGGSGGSSSDADVGYSSVSFNGDKVNVKTCWVTACSQAANRTETSITVE